ncbi:Zinc finger protein [Plakobranchus ocellatus]|uniref:Zinc finger protein n=1 Tax=Plakobranchus ocellatus TaxID=259542 RepID=A0AAV3XXR1_9GAST|nr:Zinc finger protein [Plakobranchus ocellatus]
MPTKFRGFSKRDQVLILLSKNVNNLYMHYRGPYHIQTVASINSYVCKIGNKLRTYHANLLKRFTPRTPSAPDDGILQQACLSFVDEE